MTVPVVDCKTKKLTKGDCAGKYHQTFEKEGHYILFAETKLNYVRHVADHKSNSHTVAKSIITFLQKSNIHKSCIQAIGRDGTALLQTPVTKKTQFVK